MFEGVADVAWMDRGACNAPDAPTMFPRGSIAIAEALATCAACPIRRRCRAFIDERERGLETRNLIAGVYAGEVPAQRVARRKAAAKVAADA